MIYIETGSEDVYYNFALEYYFTAVKQLEEPVFLFWRTTPTVMIGKYQNTFEEIDTRYAEKAGIQVVRRLSGGGTIYTDQGGWQFTFIQYDGSREIHFQEFIAPVVDALKELGVPAEFNGRNDLVIQGRKFSGNAQYKLNGHTVHHGSTLFQTNFEEMVKVTTVDPFKIISKSIKSVRDRVTNISEHLKEPISAEEFKAHMISSIMQGSTKIHEVTREEHEAILAIADETFRPWEVRFGANPKFSMTKTGRFAGGKIEFRLNVTKGTIKEAAVNGDFFGNDLAEGIAEALLGTRLEKQAIMDRLQGMGLSDAVYGITADDMVNTIMS